MAMFGFNNYFNLRLYQALALWRQLKRREEKQQNDKG